jgi:hypothetical protein
MATLYVRPRRWVQATALLLAISACSPPDRPARLPRELPSALLPAVGATEARVLSIAPGLAYFGVRAPDEPWATHLLRVELDRCDLGFQVLRAPARGGAAGGWSRITDLVAMGGAAVLAAVNGDFFTPEGLPVGTEVTGGEVFHTADRPAFAWRPGVAPWMGISQAGGDSGLVLGWRLPTSRADGATEALGGFPLLLQAGERVGDLEVTDRPAFAAARHPRTALGYDPGRNLLWVVVVDGRQPGYSEGMTLPELTGLLEALEVTEALNLDGGGSSVMVLRGAAVSRPSDAAGERPVVNGLGIRRDTAFCRRPS